MLTLMLLTNALSTSLHVAIMLSVSTGWSVQSQGSFLPMHPSATLGCHQLQPLQLPIYIEMHPGAARCNTWLFIRLPPKRRILFFSFFVLNR